MTRPPRACDAAGPHAPGPVRPYPAGWRCPAHTPAALAEKPEPPPGRGSLPGAWTTPIGQGVASVLDERAIATGKRRSRPADYRAAQAATRKDNP